MELEIEGSQLKKMFGKVAVLGSEAIVQFTAKDDILSVTGEDKNTQTMMIVTIPAKTIEAGFFITTVKALKGFMGIAAGTVTLKCSVDGEITGKMKKLSANLGKSQSSVVMSAWPEQAENTSFSIDVSDWERVLRDVASVAAPMNSRKQIAYKGVLFEPDDIARFVSTDGIGCTYLDVPTGHIDGRKAYNCQYLVPLDFLSMVAYAGCPDVEISLTYDRITMTCEDGKGTFFYVTRPLSGVEFPAYRKVMVNAKGNATKFDSDLAATYAHSVHFSRNDAMLVMKHALAITESGDGTVLINLKKDKAVFTAKQETISMQDEISLTAPVDEDIKFRFYASRLERALGCLETENVGLYYNNGTSSLMLVGSENEVRRPFALQPMKLTEE